MKKVLVCVLFAVFLLAMAGCGANININAPDSQVEFTMPGVNPGLDQPAANGRVAGLGTGFWHGLIAPVTLFVSFFNPAIQMYEVHNNGALYNLGFLFGIVVLLAAIVGFARLRRR